VSLRETERQIKADYETAEKLLAEGELDKALALYTKITSGISESVYFPAALYKKSKIHYTLGDLSSAEEGFQLIVSRYPVPEYYDKSQKNLADVLVEQGMYDQSIEHLKSMVFYDPFYSREEIDYYRCTILALKLRNDRQVLPELIESYEMMIGNFGQSEKIGLYRYEYSFFLNQSGNLDGALSQLGLIDTSSQNSELMEKIDLLRKEIIKER